MTIRPSKKENERNLVTPCHSAKEIPPYLYQNNTTQRILLYCLVWIFYAFHCLFKLAKKTHAVFFNNLQNIYEKQIFSFFQDVILTYQG